jgi:hypothetical protein
MVSGTLHSLDDWDLLISLHQDSSSSSAFLLPSSLFLGVYQGYLFATQWLGGLHHYHNTIPPHSSASSLQGLVILVYSSVTAAFLFSEQYPSFHSSLFFIQYTAFSSQSRIRSLEAVFLLLLEHSFTVASVSTLRNLFLCELPL